MLRIVYSAKHNCIRCFSLQPRATTSVLFLLNPFLRKIIHEHATIGININTQTQTMIIITAYFTCFNYNYITNIVHKRVLTKSNYNYNKSNHIKSNKWNNIHTKCPKLILKQITKQQTENARVH